MKIGKTTGRGETTFVGSPEDTTIDSASDKGSDVYFYVSGSISGSGTDDKKVLFGGDVRISGSLTIGTGSVRITSNDVQFSDYSTRLDRSGNDLRFFDSYNTFGPTLTQLLSSGADISASYVVVGTTSSLPNERALTVGTGIIGTDGGAGSTYTLSIDDSVVATLSGSIGSPNTVLWSDGSATSWNGNPIVTSLSASSYVAAGPDPATTGAVRLGNNQWIYSRNVAGTGNVLVVGQANGTVQVGDGSTALTLAATSVRVPTVVGAGPGDLVVKSNATVGVGTGILLQAYATGVAAYQTGFSTFTTAGNWTTVHLAPSGQNVYVFGTALDGGGQGVLSLGSAVTAPTASATNQALVWNSSGTMTLQGNAGVNINVDTVLAIPFTSASTTSYASADDGDVLTKNATSGSIWGKVTSGSIASGAVTTSSIAPGSENTVLWSNGSTTSWNGNPIVTSLSASSYVGVGAAPLPTTGDVRLRHGASIYGRNSADSGQSAIIRWGDGIANSLQVGNGTFITYIDSGSPLYIRTGGSNRLNISTSGILFESTETPVLSQVTHATTPHTFTIQAQNVTAGDGSDFDIKTGAGTTNSGSMNLFVGAKKVATFTSDTATEWAAGSDGYVAMISGSGGRIGWGPISSISTGSLTPGSAYDVLQTNAAGTGTEWTNVVRHTRISVNHSDDPNISAHFASPDDTSGTRGLRVVNASHSYVHVDVSGDGQISFGASATSSAVWGAYEGSGTGYIISSAVSGAFIGTYTGPMYVRAIETGQPVYLDAPTTGGTVVSRVGPSYTNVHTVMESGVVVSNNFAVGTSPPDANVAGLFQAADDTSGKYPLLARNASGYYHLYVSGEGVVGFGGGAAVNAVWIAYESGGYAFLREGTANGSLIESTANNARLRASGTGRAVLLEAPTTGGAIYSSVGPGYTAVHTVSESGVTISNRVAVGTSLDANVAGLFYAEDSTGSKYSLIARNSNGVPGLTITSSNFVQFGGTATQAHVWEAYYDGSSDAVLRNNTGNATFLANSGVAIIRAAVVGASVYLDAPTTGGTIVSRAGSYSAIHTVAAAGVTVSNNLAIRTPIESAVTALFHAPGDTSGDYALATRNASGYGSLYVRGDGVVMLGGSATTNPAWNVFESGGYGQLQSTSANGATIWADNAYLSLTGAGGILYLNAPTAGGHVWVRAGTGYDSIASFNEGQMDLYRQLAIQLDNSGGDGLRMYYWETSGTGPLLFGHKARGTAASPADIGQYDVGLSLSAYGWAGSQWNEMGNLYFRSGDATPGAGDIATELLIYMDPGGATATRLVLHSYPYGGEGGVYINDFVDGYVMASRITSGIGPDGNVRAYFAAESTSGSKYSLLCTNSAGNATLAVHGDGSVDFGAGLLSGWDFAWQAYLYDDGFGYKESRLYASGTDKNALVGVNGTGKVLYLEALGSGGWVAVRVGPSYTVAQYWSESSIDFGISEVRFGEALTNATLRYVQRAGDAATKTLLIVGQAASSTSTGTNQNGGILLLYGGSAYGSGVGGKVGIQGNNGVNVTFFGADEATGGKGVITVYNATSLPSSSPTNTSTIYSTGGRPAWVTAAGDDIEWVSTSSTSATAGTYAFPDTVEEFMLIRYNGNLRKIPLFAD